MEAHDFELHLLQIIGMLKALSPMSEQDSKRHPWPTQITTYNAAISEAKRLFPNDRLVQAMELIDASQLDKHCIGEMVQSLEIVLASHTHKQNADTYRVMAASENRLGYWNR